MSIKYFNFVIIALLTTSCTSKVAVNKETPNLQFNKTPIKTNSDTTDYNDIRACNIEAEKEVSQQCLISWRLALNNKEDEAVKQLLVLQKKYPNIASIDLMLAQIKEHSGKKDEACKYYQKSVKNCPFNSLYLLKLANSLIDNKKPQQAMVYYKVIEKRSPKFIPAHVGLARCYLLMQPFDKEKFLSEIDIIRELDPNSAELVKLSKDAKL